MLNPAYLQQKMTLGFYVAYVYYHCYWVITGYISGAHSFICLLLIFQYFIEVLCIYFVQNVIILSHFVAGGFPF